MVPLCLEEEEIIAQKVKWFSVHDEKVNKASKRKGMTGVTSPPPESTTDFP